MTRTEFLGRVLASEGRVCIYTGKPYPQNRFFDSIQEADDYLTKCVAENKDTYYGLATFGSHEDKRTADNALFLKSFFLDLDCGDEDKVEKGTGYSTKDDAMLALRAFCKEVKLPKPMVVDSGGGLHVYWTLLEPVSKAEWLPIARGFKKLCMDHKLAIDPACPADAARVLRPMGTMNCKQPDNLREVVLKMDAAPITLDAFRNAVPVMHAPARSRTMDATTRALLGNQITKFVHIVKKTAAGNGCSQLQYALENRESLDEPMWRAWLSVAQVCEDRVKAVRMLSEGYPGYQLEEALDKAERTGGPYKCTSFEPLRPSGCDGCPNKGKVVTPAQLGREVLQATPEQSLFQQEVAQPDGSSQFVTQQIPEYPEPFMRAPHGGVYLRTVNPDGTPDDTLVYENDLYVTGRVWDTAEGEVITLRVHPPRDDIKDFTIPLKDVVAGDRLRDALARQGIVANTPKEWMNLMRYITTWTKKWQSEAEAERSHHQFGWTEDDDAFVLGTREFIPNDSPRPSPASVATVALAPHFEPKGTIEEWKSVVNMYGRPGNEVRAFAFFMGFGAPLIKMTRAKSKGALLHLLSSDSGTGKSTVQMAINSIYGKPYELLLQKADTVNAKIHRLGIMNTLPVTIDEITNMTPEQMSELAYAITQGRGKDRMETHGNKLRENTTRWHTTVISSGNSSVYDKLQSLKASADGELMRVMEFRIERDETLTKEQADAIFGKLQTNYGLAGGQYIQHILRDLDNTRKMVAATQAHVDEVLNISSRERYWSAMITCALTGAKIAKHLGLHDIPVNPVLGWLKTALPALRGAADGSGIDAGQIISAYLNEFSHNTLTINGKRDPITNLYESPIREPRLEPVIRYEPDTQKIAVSSRHLQAWCVKHQVSYKDLLTDLGVAGTVKRRLMAGTRLPSTLLTCVEFDNTNGVIHVAAPAGNAPDDTQR